MKRTSVLFLGVTLLLGIFVMITLAGVSAGSLLIVIPALLIWLFVWVLPAALKRMDSRVWIVTGLLILIGLIFPTSSLMSRDYEMGPFSKLTSTTLFLLPSLALVNAALLLYARFGKTVSDTVNDRLPEFSFVLSILLIGKTLHNIYDLTLWDNTYDSLDYFWLIVPIFTVILSGLALSFALSGRMKRVGTAYVIILPVVLIATSALAQRVDFRQETAKRAERTVQAIESYYESNGQYPESLSQLRPRYILSLPKPMIIYGKDWCYEGGDDHYRLGYVDREHWSSPYLIRRIYKTAGEYLETGNFCEEGITRLIEIDPMLTVSDE
jgi:hypothetical protein